MTRPLAFGLILAAVALQTAASHAALIGDYQLTQGNLTNAFTGSGALDSLTVTQTGGTVGFDASGWSWSGATGSGTGLIVNLPPAVTSVYSLGVTVSLGQIDGYRRLINFADDRDTGLYVSDGKIEFYGDVFISGGSVSANTPFTFILTRDAAADVNIYLNGSSAPIVNVNDPTGVAIATNNVLKLFVDNSVGDSTTAPTDEFSASGTVSAVRFWDSALGSLEIPTAMDVAPVPEPSTWAQGVAGVTCTAWGMARRRRRAAGSVRQA